ncbi:MAG: hypothetical protein COU69_01735 [Candidatus Pacebacteria bacterium CG10_big_fil_rev_8_21_14_0_10_56_10]|nr:MAG: hypothetical protein COU69_01735 [Candidatus Pacebacteria bacterium CG10_big_fil_rev_8_21_14_0_10_56_10]
MKILMLTPYLPYPLLSGGQIRTYNLIKKLSRKHDITLFALIKEENERQYIPEIEKYCSQVKVFKRSHRPFTLANIIKTGLSSYPFLVIRNYVKETISAVEAELGQQRYDLIHAETFYMMPHIPTTSVPTILVEQTIEYLGYESFAQNVTIPFIQPLLKLDIAKIKRWEKHYWQNCKKLIVMSEEDKRLIATEINDNDKIEVVSNGVDTAWFAQADKQLPPDPTILSVGTFNWLPNVEAVEFLVHQVWPLIKARLPRARLWIVGNNPSQSILNYQLGDERITVTGRLADIRQAFNGAHVLVAPVLSGKGTRYKILESMASQTPIVATSLAVEGLGARHNVHVLTANTAQQMADATIKLLQDTKLQRKLAKNGRRFVESHYDWEQISRKLDRIYLEFAARPHQKHV